MKKILTLLISFVLLFNTVYAEELEETEVSLTYSVEETTTEEKEITETLDDKEVQSPTELSTSSEIIVNDTVAVCNESGYYGECYSWTLTFSFTIPEDYNKETIEFSPEVYENIKEVLSYNGIEPGDKFTINFKMTNNSKYTYTYDESSFVVFPDNEEEYDKISDEKKFNDTEASELNTFRRRYNSALYALNIKEGTKLTDEVLDSSLKNAGYNGIDDYTKYLLDFYNNKYGTNNTNLNEFNYGIIKEIFGGYDPFYTNNEAYYKWTYKDGDSNNKYSSLGQIMTENSSSSKKEVISTINSLVKNEGYTKKDGSADINKYLIDFYNNKYNLNITTLNDLTSTTAYKLFAETDKSYNIGRIDENNPTLLALYFDYFYNKCISWSFENDKVTDQNSHEYSFGEYMRDENKGDSEIIESIGKLNPNETKELNNMSVNYNGHYINNVGQLTKYDWNVQLTYSMLKGKLIVKYIDDEGNILSETENYEEPVGEIYKTNEKEFEYYKLIEIQGNESGKYIDGTIEVVYIYSFVGGTGGDIVDLDFPKTGVNTNNIPEVIFISSTLLLLVTILFKKKLSY